MRWVELLVGAGSELTIIQMAFRAACIFMLALLMLRTAGRRSIGKHDAFDACVAVLLGLASVRWQSVEDLIKRCAGPGIDGAISIQKTRLGK